MPANSLDSVLQDVILSLCACGSLGIAILLMSWGLNAGALAQPQDYCEAFSRQMANNKTGEVVEGSQKGSQKWQDEQNKAFNTCIETYTADQSASSVEAQKPLASTDRPVKSKKAKSRQRTKRTHSKARAIANAKASTKAEPSRVSGAKSAVQSSAQSNSAKGTKGLCRHLKVNAKGGYRIEKC